MSGFRLNSLPSNDALDYPCESELFIGSAVFQKNGESIVSSSHSKETRRNLEYQLSVSLLARERCVGSYSLRALANQDELCLFPSENERLRYIEIEKSDYILGESKITFSNNKKGDTYIYIPKKLWDYAGIYDSKRKIVMSTAGMIGAVSLQTFEKWKQESQRSDKTFDFSDINI